MATSAFWQISQSLQRGVNQARIYALSKGLVALVALFACCFSFAAQAQPTQQANSINGVNSVNAFDPIATVADIGELTSQDLSDMDAAWWKSLSKANARALGSSDEQVKEQALQNIIFFATHYGKDVDFKRATTELYNIYRFDKNEARRIMALAALHAIGRENTMRILSQHVRWERSPRVRRLTKAALVDYYAHAAP